MPSFTSAVSGNLGTVNSTSCVENCLKMIPAHTYSLQIEAKQRLPQPDLAVSFP